MLYQAEDKKAQKLVEREGVLQVSEGEMQLINMHGHPAGKQPNVTVRGVTRVKVRFVVVDLSVCLSVCAKIGRRQFRLKPHRTLPIGQKLVEIGCVIDAADFHSGRFFLVYHVFVVLFFL